MRVTSNAERALLAVLALWSLLPLAIVLLDLPEGRFTGSDGIQIGDHLQYMAWIRDAGEHVLFSNRFDVVQDPHLFLHPMWVVSGLAWQLGASVQLAFLLWKPVGVLVLFWGFAAYVRRMLGPSGGARAAGLALALFFFAPVAWVTDWTGVGSADLGFGSLVIALELFPAGLVWGVIPTAISLGTMALFLLGIERLLEPERRAPGRSGRWYAGWCAVAGALTSWLHPWQGLILLAIVGGLVVWARGGRSVLRLAVPVAATTVPLGYYWLLSNTDSAWATVSQPNGMPHVGAWLFLALGTALALAAPGISRRVEGVQERALLLWPVASLAVYFALQSSFFYHAFAGLTLPLAVLTVRGAQRLRLSRALGAFGVALLTVPGMALAVALFVRGSDERVLEPGEAAALDYLERSDRPGAVLAPVRLGRTVPAFTGRNTWVGHPTWTPSNPLREQQADDLFSGRLEPAAAAELVSSAGVSFLVADCEHPGDLRPALGPALTSVRRFGCATVYVLDEPTATSRRRQPAGS